MIAQIEEAEAREAEKELGDESGGSIIDPFNRPQNRKEEGFVEKKEKKEKKAIGQQKRVKKEKKTTYRQKKHEADAKKKQKGVG